MHWRQDILLLNKFSKRGHMNTFVTYRFWYRRIVPLLILASIVLGAFYYKKTATVLGAARSPQAGGKETQHPVHHG